MSDVRWTAKLPALLLSVALFAIGLIVEKSGWRYAVFAALLLFLGAGGFLYWSLSIKDWCVVNPNSAFSAAFSPSLRGCLRQKGWFEL